MRKGRDERLLGWKSGGFVLVAAAVLAAGSAIWVLRSTGDTPVLRAPFERSSSRVPPERITDTGLGRDGIPALDRPATMRGSDVAAFNAEHRGKYLVSGDRVVGVSIAGAARAYPLRVLAWHEVANDVVAGVPIAVTYHPLCDSVVVFDRRSGGETLELGTSGLLYESNLVLYDRRTDPATSSLWSQLRAEAIAGPAAARGLTLDVLPASLLRWGEWLALHPETTVLRPDERYLERYERDTYGNYLLTRRLRYPVATFPPPGPFAPWTHVLVPLPATGEVHALDGTATAQDGVIASGELEIRAGNEPASVVAAPGTRKGTAYALWWAWHATHPPAAATLPPLAPNETLR